MTINNNADQLGSDYDVESEEAACKDSVERTEDTVTSIEDTVGQERIDATDVEDLYDNQWIPKATEDNEPDDTRMDGWSFLGIQFAPINIPLQRRLQTLAVLLWFCFILIIGWSSFLILVYIALYTNYWWFPLAYLTWYIGDRSISVKGGRRFTRFRKLKLWDRYTEYFPLTLIKTADLDPRKNYIMGYHPHGVLAAGAVGNFATEGTNFSKKYPGITPYALTLPLNFHMPFTREILMASGMASCSKESMDYLLGQAPGSGHAVLLVPGGAKESTNAKPGTAILYLKKRIGFIKIALRHGASLVPIYSFGENEIYNSVDNPEGSLLRKFQDKLEQLVGLSPVIFQGRGIFQYSFGLMPFRKPMYTVVGAPIDVQQVTEPTTEQIMNLHSKYVDALTELYNKHRHTYSPYPNVDLKII
ncbi:unnamed protein product [Meganyctiphanes norvegica]|uniref:Acyltransferase n=1 Tax=Meganyctiphanes norvegica TaxID=48144 RepID=A0AAV2QE36_MEGNR